MGQTPNPVVTRDEYDNAQQIATAIRDAGTLGRLGVSPATLGDDTRVIALTTVVEHGEVPLAIVIDARKDGDNTLFHMLTPVDEDAEIVLEDVEESA